MKYVVAAKFKPFLYTIDFLGSCLFFWTKWKKFTAPKSILLIRLEHIGDCILTTPTLSAIKKAFPNESISSHFGRAYLVYKNGQIESL